jgi:fused signal recognition particle receptor
MTSFFGRIKQALTNTSNKISSGLTNIFLNKKLDSSTIQELEDLLISADMGVATVDVIIDQIKKIKFEKDIEVALVQAKISEIITDLLLKHQKDLVIADNRLNIILVCGVNGNGKTTTIGKLASMFKKEGKRVIIGACDTFRAAAIDQLQIWADRAGCELITGPHNSDPASVAFVAAKEAIEKKADILMIDTAGRLHNQQNLMAELEKITKVIEKAIGFPPQHNILVLDATTGQNAFNQVEQFGNIANVNGLIVTKLDGTAKAGVIVGLSERFKIPIYYVGLGESIDDLKKFEAKDFADALVGIQ